MAPHEFALTITPRSRYDAIDVAALLSREHGDVLSEFQRAVYCSYHTTAGYLDQPFAARLQHRRDRLDPFIRLFQGIFPPDSDYRHDQVELRTELTEEQRRTEPRNADSHLTFIGAGLKNLVTYVDHAHQPVYFIDLDGVNGDVARQRQTTILAYDEEETVARVTVRVPVSRHPVDSVNLADPKLGVLEEISDLLPRVGIEKGRVDVNLDPSEQGAGLTVNEYETLLMRHDLMEVLRDPVKHAKSTTKRMWRDPMAIPGKSLGYAKYDLVHLFNEVMDTFRVNESVIETLLSRFLAVPARRFLRLKRSLSLLVSDRGSNGAPSLVGGTYQSPILVQWQTAPRQARTLVVSIKRFS